MAEQSTPQATFSFRWGVDLFDNEHTQIPNWILAYYHQVPWVNGNKSGEGISNTEMMFIIHLASFKYESTKGKSTPSLTHTLKERMGYKTNQGIINVQEGLVSKGLLIVHKNPGRRSLYDFTPFSKKVLKLAITNEFDDELSPDNPSTKIDESVNSDLSDPSTKIDADPSTKIDATRLQNLTQRKEEEKNPKEQVGLKINFELPPYPHHQIKDKWAYLLNADGMLTKVYVKDVTAKRVRLVVNGVDGSKLYDPTNHVFYQNGHSELQPVVIADEITKIELTPGALAIKNTLIDLMPQADFVPKTGQDKKRMKDINEAAVKADQAGLVAEDFEQFDIWRREISWNGKSPPVLTLKVLRDNWAEFTKYQKGKKEQPNGNHNQSTNQLDETSAGLAAALRARTVNGRAGKTNSVPVL